MSPKLYYHPLENHAFGQNVLGVEALQEPSQQLGAVLRQTHPAWAGEWVLGRGVGALLCREVHRNPEDSFLHPRSCYIEEQFVKSQILLSKPSSIASKAFCSKRHINTTAINLCSWSASCMQCINWQNKVRSGLQCLKETALGQAAHTS